MARCASVALLGVAVQLSACGGAESESAQVHSVVQSYFAAIERHDGSKMCSLFTGAAKQEVMQAAELVSRLHRRKALTCSEYLTVVFEGNAHQAGLERVTKVTIGPGGDTATARVSQPGEAAGELPLTRTPDGWRIGTRTPTFPSQPREAETGGPPAISVKPPPAVAHSGGDTLARFNSGRTVAAQSGCLACHRIGEAGNAGPGPDLTHIGATRSPAAIERAILSPTEPMPSFRNLPKAKLRALVTFLSLLRS
jgi:mono/diheme cytochrome c family protein